MKRAIWVAWAIVSGMGCGVRGDGSAPSPEAPAAEATAHYLANAGVLVERGDLKIVFDPLFRNDYDTYRLLPRTLEDALFTGSAPFDGLDAVLVSHYHGDHFSAVDLVRLLSERPELALYAPAQAVAEMKKLAGSERSSIFERVTSVALQYKDPPQTYDDGPLLVEAVRIPHSGWPTGRLDVENLAFRVTLGGETTVLHLGDADTKDVHFARDADYWSLRRTDMAFPPYWYFGSDDGRGVLDQRLVPGASVGVHVPKDMPSRSSERPEEYRGVDLFTEPGETRAIEN